LTSTFQCEPITQAKCSDKLGRHKLII